MIVYAITCLLTGARYIGQTVRPLTRRWAQHLNDARRNSKCYLHQAIRKYGAENFAIRPLVIVGSKAEMDYYEAALIKAFHTKRPLGFNLTDGGEGLAGYKPSPEQIARRRAQLLGKKRPPFSADWKANLSASMKGRVFSAEHRAKLSAAQMGNTKCKGAIRSTATRVKMSAAKMGNTGWMNTPRFNGRFTKRAA